MASAATSASWRTPLPTAMYRIAETPALFVKQLGIKPGDVVDLRGAPLAFASPVAEALGEGATLLATEDTSSPPATIVLLWPDGMAHLMQAIHQRIALGTATLSAFWVVIPKKPVAERTGSDLFFQDVLDNVLPTGLVDNKTLTFSEEEYGIRFVPRRQAKGG